MGELFPGSLHVNALRMARSSDGGLFGIWQHALEEGLTIVTKDRDFVRLSNERGHPPKVIRITLGNCSWEAIAELLQERRLDIVGFYQDESRGLLKLP